MSESLTSFICYKINGDILRVKIPLKSEFRSMFMRVQSVSGWKKGRIGHNKMIPF
jgi:hypothetical protein